MDEVLELVVVIPTSSRSSKTESGCKIYGHFHIAISCRPDNLGWEGADYSNKPALDFLLRTFGCEPQ
jgi:hypothetical protein